MLLYLSPKYFSVNQLNQMHVNQLHQAAGALTPQCRPTHTWYQNNTHESIAPGLAGLPIGDDHRLLDVSVHLEVLPEAGVRGVVGQTPHEDLSVRGVLLHRVHHLDSVKGRKRRSLNYT